MIRFMMKVMIRVIVMKKQVAMILKLNDSFVSLEKRIEDKVRVGIRVRVGLVDYYDP
jgi:hypothetical protein